jgi:hypothetical protein
MPLYKHNVTGNEFTATEDYVSALPEGAVTKIADESPEEEAARLQQEAVENKVEVEFDGDPDAPPADDAEGESAPKATRASAKKG